MDLKTITNSDETGDPAETHFEDTQLHEDEEEASHSVLPSELTDDENIDSEGITNNPQSPFLDSSGHRDDVNDSDSTVSESAAASSVARAADYKTNLEDVGVDADVDITDIDLNLEDETIQEYNCHWQGCDANFNQSKQLTNHIVDQHVKENGQLLCLWDQCLERLPNRISLITHIRRHSKETPYFCQSVDCTETFGTSKDLLTHLSSIHNDENVNKVPWLNYLNELLDHNVSIEQDPWKNIKAARDRYSTIHTETEFESSVTKPKIDFLKVQNIQVGDIVAEPSKKKGRTANSEINVEIRSDFKTSNDAYKQLLIDSSKGAFEKLEGLEVLPNDHEIESKKETELIELYETLNRKFLWSLEVEQLLKKEFEESKLSEHELWLSKEALLEASIQVEIPEDEQFYDLNYVLN